MAPQRSRQTNPEHGLPTEPHLLNKSVTRTDQRETGEQLIKRALNPM